jgi:lysophospholipase L1-like esterase
MERLEERVRTLPAAAPSNGIMDALRPERLGGDLMRRVLLAAVLLVLILDRVTASGSEPPPLRGVHRVVFLGDSITYSGQYIEFIEAVLRVQSPELRCEFINIGLPSETVSGLSEPGHAGGKFARPDLHERLDRVLAKSKPELVVACYGMNDGIYHPFGAERFEKFRDGMRFLRERSAASGARVLHLTPPVFDPVPIKAKTLPAGRAEYRQPYEGYDEVLEQYSAWLLAQRTNGWDVVDVHGPLKRHLIQERARDPGFRLAGDGVHLNPTGHWLIAREILLHWGIPRALIAESTDGVKVLSAHLHGLEVLNLIQGKQRTHKDAWLSATGHGRPGMKQGLPLAEAELQVGKLDGEIRTLLGP